MRVPDFIYLPKEAVKVKFIPRQDGVALGMGSYTASAALDGTTSNLRCYVSVQDSDGNYATTVDSISCDSVTMYRGDSSNSDACELTFRKGFNPSSTTDYVVTVWYDSTGGGSGGVRLKDTKVIRILVESPIDNTPPYT